MRLVWIGPRYNPLEHLPDCISTGKNGAESSFGEEDMRKLLLMATLAFVGTGLSAQSQNTMTMGTYGDWRVDMSQGSAEALTSNGSGSILGVICLESCNVYLNNLQRCEQAALYPVMVNTATGAHTLSSACFVDDDNRHFLIFAIDDSWMRIFRAGGVVGFALPMESGEFHVSRFSLNGAAEALVGLSDLVEGRHGQFLRDRTY